jgi:hypothetical protein
MKRSQVETALAATQAQAAAAAARAEDLKDREDRLKSELRQKDEALQKLTRRQHKNDSDSE